MEAISNIGNLMNLSEGTTPLDRADNLVDQIDAAVLELDKSR